MGVYQRLQVQPITPEVRKNLKMQWTLMEMKSIRRTSSTIHHSLRPLVRVAMPHRMWYQTLGIVQ